MIYFTEATYMSGWLQISVTKIVPHLVLNISGWQTIQKMEQTVMTCLSLLRFEMSVITGIWFIECQNTSNNVGICLSGNKHAIAIV